MVIAPTLHWSTHAPQRVHSSPIIAILSTSVIAPKGHAFSHNPHPVHFSLSTFIRLNHLIFR